MPLAWMHEIFAIWLGRQNRELPYGIDEPFDLQSGKFIEVAAISQSCKQMLEYIPICWPESCGCFLLYVLVHCEGPFKIQAFEVAQHICSNLRSAVNKREIDHAEMRAKG
jgi:hypothetical protein